MNTFSSKFKIEPEYQQPFEAWKAEPTPQTSGAVLRALQPAIDQGIRAYAGKSVGPTTKSHARKITLQALKTYDPAKAALGTHVINHLKGLRRIQRQQAHILRTPERVMLDRGRLEDSRVDLEDRLGREPSTQELADYTGLSPKRIEYVRKFRSPVSEGLFSARSVGGEMSGFAPAVSQQSDVWLRAVYTDLNPTNQKILEWSAGLFGQPVLSNKEIARRLRLTPGAISQRKAIIQQQINQREELSPF